MEDTLRYFSWIPLVLSAVLSAATWIRNRNKDSIAAGGWFPGCFFGLALGLAHLSNYDFLIALGLASGGAFVLAITIALRINAFEHIDWFGRLSVGQRIRNLGINTAAGALAGAVGAMTVSAATKLLAGTKIDFRMQAVETAVGALCGILFLHFVLQNRPASVPGWLKMVIAFLLWQLPVG